MAKDSGSLKAKKIANVSNVDENHDNFSSSINLTSERCISQLYPSNVKILSLSYILYLIIS